MSTVQEVEHMGTQESHAILLYHMMKFEVNLENL